MKNSLKILLKFLFAGLIVAWLIKSGKLEFNLVQKSLASGYSWLWCILLITTQDIGAAFRWKIFLEAKSEKKLPFLQVIKLTWIGLFFNSVLPGAVTGDLIKLVYARDLDRSMSRTFLVTTALMDRIIGLIGLLSLLGISTLIYYNELVLLSPQMKKLVHFNFLLFVGVIFFFITLFLPKKMQDFIVKLSDLIPVIGKRITKTLLQVWFIGSNKKKVFLCYLISIFVQSINVFAFWMITSPFYGKELPLQYVFTFIPLGHMAVAVPISPSGLGVGHFIFDTLFSYVGIMKGASLFNLYFLCLIFVNLFGFFPYVFGGKKHTLHEAEEFEHDLEKNA